MADLITAAYAKRRINQSSFTAAEDSTIDDLVDEVGQAIRRFCRREFDSQAFDQLYHGSGQEKLVLEEFPVVSVARVAYNPQTAIEVENTSSSIQRATVAVTSTAVVLVRVASGATTTTTLTLADADKDTLSELVTAINAVGNGWSATLVASGQGGRASADLRNPQGAFNAKSGKAQLKLHLDELYDWELDEDRGFLFLYGTSNVNHPAVWDGQGRGWWGGRNYWRVVYTAGYASVPSDIQGACAEWVAALFWQSKRDPGLGQEQVPGIVSRSDRLVNDGLPEHIRRLLLPYQKHGGRGRRGM